MSFGNSALLAILATGLISAVACKKERQAQAPEALYEVDRTASSTPNNFLHRTFSVSSYTRFEFEIPPHSLSPKLEGSFKAFAAGNPHAPGNVDLLLLTPEQFADFTHGAGEPTYAVMSSSEQSVNYALPGTTVEPQKYYLVFRNLAQGSARSVQADFTASF